MPKSPHDGPGRCRRSPAGQAEPRPDGEGGEPLSFEVLDFATDGAWDYRLESRVVYCGANLHATLGYEMGQVGNQAKDWLDLVHPEDRNALREAIVSHLRGRRPRLGFRMRIAAAGGDWKWVLVLGRVVERDAGGRAVRMVGAITDISDLVLKERELSASEEKYRILVENQTDLVVKVDRQGFFQFVSPSYCELFGKSEDELLGSDLMPLVHHEDQAATSRAMESLYRPPYHAYMEQRALTRKGWRWLAWMDTAVLDDSGRVTGFIGVGRDVTEQRLAEQRLEQERAQLLSIFDSTSEAIYISDPHTHELLFANRAMVKQFGEVAGRKCYEVLQGRDTPCPFCTNRHIFGENVGKTYVWGFRNQRNGRWFHCVDRAIKWPDGRMVRFEMAMDITDQRNAQDALASRLLHERALARAARELMMDTDSDQAAEKALGYMLSASGASRVHIFENRLDPSLGLCMSQTHEVCAPGVESRFGNPLLQNLPYGELYGRWARILGEGKPIMGPVRDMPEAEREMLESQGILSLLVLPLRIMGRWFGFIGFDSLQDESGWNEEDVTLLETAAQLFGAYFERRSSQQLLRQVAAGVAHNFNNILMAVTSNTEAALQELPATKKMDSIRTLLEGVLRAGSNGRDIVRRLSSYLYNEPQDQRSRQVLEMADLASTALDLVRAITPHPVRRAIDYQMDVEPALWVKGARGELVEVLINIIKNATEAMPMGGELVISGRAELGEVQLAVSDSGPGLTEQAHSQIFEPFYTTKGVLGLGLGLTSSMGIVAGHGGSLEVFNRPEGGASFVIRLPLCEPPARRERSGGEVAAQSSGAVLLVEDESLVAMGVSSLLEGQGYRVGVAACVAEALSMLPEMNPDLVLCDVGLPDGTAWDVLRGMVAQGQQDLPMVAITGWGVGEALRQKPDDLPDPAAVVDKPVERQVLLGVLARFMPDAA